MGLLTSFTLLLALAALPFASIKDIQDAATSVGVGHCRSGEVAVYEVEKTKGVQFNAFISMNRRVAIGEFHDRVLKTVHLGFVDENGKLQRMRSVAVTTSTGPCEWLDVETAS